jgi:hypothetical protein
VEPATQAAVGRVAIAAGRLEWVAARLASAHVVDFSEGGFAKLTRRLARAAREDPPPWSRLDLDPFVSWTTAARRAMDARNKELHAGHMRLGGTQVTSHVRTGSLLPVDLDDLDRRASELATLGQDGLGYLTRCLPEVVPGLWVLLPVPLEGPAMVFGSRTDVPDHLIEAACDRWGLRGLHHDSSAED